MTSRPAQTLPDLVHVDLGQGVRAGFTTQAHGNLALDVGDDPHHVHHRRHALKAWAGVPVRFAHHVHGITVLSPEGNHALGPDPVGDAWCATAASTPLAVYAADCLPVLLAAPAARVIAAAHAGRVGLVAGVLVRTIEAMRARGAQDIRAIIGPAICSDCYEVPAELAASSARFDLPVAQTRWRTPSLDLPTIAVTQLARHGVEASAMDVCTYDSDQFFSQRRTEASASSVAHAGRHAGIIALT